MTVESSEVSVMSLTDAGFVEMRSLLSDGRAMAVADAVRRADAREVEACRRQNSALVPLRWNDRAVSLVLTDSSAMARVRAVTGDGDLRWVSAYVSIKESDSGPTPWHQDWWCWNNAISHAACAPQVALVCFLDDVHGRRAALRVLPKAIGSDVTSTTRCSTPKPIFPTVTRSSQITLIRSPCLRRRETQCSSTTACSTEPTRTSRALPGRA